MYIVRFRTSKIVAYRSHSSALARLWLEANDFDPETGDCLNLFELAKD